mmetsp:Transcript_64515/g.172783  ORF Transcript_64515/g.172783 Transcript_64515/m.172783 type:complete len:93 (-) Transcript_64515:556-834(-)
MYSCLCRQFWSLNPELTDPDASMEAGQLVRVGRIYTTQSGDTPASLTRRLGLGSVADLAARNLDLAGQPDGTIGVGQEICFIPTSCPGQLVS